MALLQFLFNTAAQGANTPSSKLFLPDRLAEIPGHNSQGKLLPFEQPELDVGNLTGSTSTTVTTIFLNQWGFYLEVTGFPTDGQFPIPDPANPSPRLMLGGEPGDVVTIDGIRNMYIADIEQTSQTDTATGFRLTLNMNHWTAANAGHDIPSLSVITPYTLSQAMCLAKEGSKTCSGLKSEDVHGQGMTTVAITNARIIADVTVTIQGGTGQRSLLVTIGDVCITGIDDGTDPVLTVKELTIKSSIEGGKQIWKKAATQALENVATSQAIFANINTQLRAEHTRNSIAQEITTQLQGVLDDLLGKVQGVLPRTINEGGQTQVDGYLYDRMFYAMNTESSPWYLPRTICQVKNPALDPYTAGTITIPDQNFQGLTFKNITLSNLTIVGLSNLIAPSKTTTFAPNTISINALIASLQPPPKLDCCQIPAKTQITSSFAAQVEGVDLTAGLTVDVTAATLAVTANATGEISSDLTVIVKDMQLLVSNLDSITITVTLNSAFKGFINDLLNSPSIKTAILSEINTQIKTHLPEISKAATTYAKSMINANLT